MRAQDNKLSARPPSKLVSLFVYGCRKSSTPNVTPNTDSSGYPQAENVRQQYMPSPYDSQQRISDCRRFITP